MTLSEKIALIRAYIAGQIGSGPCGNYPAPGDEIVPDNILDPAPGCDELDDQYADDVVECFEERGIYLDANCCTPSGWDQSCVENYDPQLHSCLTAARTRYEERCAEA